MGAGLPFVYPGCVGALHKFNCALAIGLVPVCLARGDDPVIGTANSVANELRLMTFSRPTPSHSKNVFLCAGVLVAVAVAVRNLHPCEPSPTPDATTVETQREPSAIEKLSDKDIEWDGLGFHGGPRLVGENALAIWRRDVRQSVDLIKRLEDDNACVAAHVLLTDLWRVKESKKDTFSHPLSDGFFVCYNGFHVRITWADVSGEVKKTVVIPDLDCQRKRIREFWKTRFREHPDEFSLDTKVE